MRILYIFLLFFVCIFSAEAQVTFDPGYFIDNSGNRTECFIKNADLERNSNGLVYKLVLNDPPQKKTNEEISEYGIYGYSRYIKSKVMIDLSSDELNHFSTKRNPTFQKKTLCLKVILSGKASLYSYYSSGLQRFFFSVGAGQIEPLVYKKYKIDVNQVGENNSFRQQLWTRINCNNATLKSVESIPYTEEALVKYFKEYNDCSRDSNVVYRTVRNTHFFHLKVAPGVNSTTIHLVTGNYFFNDLNFGTKLCFRFGLEGELTMPYNRKKWRIVIEPTFQQFKSGKLYKRPFTTELDYKSIEFPIGLRYYSYLNKNLSLYYNAFYISNYSLNWHTTLRNEWGDYWALDPNSSFALGTGVVYKRLSAEVRYYTNRELFNFLFNGNDNYKRVAFIIGFRIF